MNIVREIKKIKKEREDLANVCQEYLDSVYDFYHIDFDDDDVDEEELLEVEDKIESWLLDDLKEDANKLYNLLFL